MMTESTTRNEFQEDLNCGFCLQKLTYMIEPKQLPCSHVFCLPCLEEDPKKDCPVCGKLYGPEWTGMRVYMRPSETDNDVLSTKNPAVSFDHILCDICTEKKAVCYCLDCEKTLCDHDFKLHQQSSVFFTSKHQQIDISVYASNPERYTPVYCSDHEDQKITVACYNCHQVFCQVCQPKQSSCPQSKEEEGIHATSSISMMADNMRLKLHARIKKIADQVTEGLNLEKKTWSNLYDVECEVTQMMSDIDEMVEKAIEKISESAGQMKMELKAHQAKSLSAVETYSSQLIEQRDRLETQWKELNRRFQDMKGTEVIIKFESLKQSIDISPPAPYEAPPELACRALSQSPDFKELFADQMFSKKRISVPESIGLKYLRTLTANGVAVHSVSWHGEDIVCGTDKGVLTLNEHSPNKQVNIRGDVNCIRKIERYTFAILYDKDGTEREVRISCKNTLADPKTTLCSFPTADDNISHISVSEKYIAACDVEDASVRVWNTKGEHLMKIGDGHLDGPYSVFIQDDSVLVSDYETGCLYKFRLQTDSQPVWTCRDLDSPSGICVDQHGFIYVNSDLGNAIYVITHKGVLMKTLFCEELNKAESVLDISLSDNETTVALACREEGVKIFTLTS